MNVLIEQATVADAEAILALQKLAYQTEAEIYNDFSLPPLTESLDQHRDLFATHVFLKAVVDQALAGSVRGSVREGTCYVGRLVVHPDWRRQGLGTRLLKAIEARFPEVERFELFTGHRSEGNLRLYQRLGYTRTKTVAVHDGLSLIYLEKRTV